MLLNYTTKIEPEQSIAEIQKMLTRFGVSAMMTEYEGRAVSGVSFKIEVKGSPMGFKLPCNWRAVRAVFAEQGITTAKTKHKDKDLDSQAIRTSWRIIKDWVEAQLALVEVNMTTVPQVFLPYAITKDGRTLAERMDDDPRLLLGD